MSKNLSKLSLTNDNLHILEICEKLFSLALLHEQDIALLELLGGCLPGGGQKVISELLLGIFLHFIIT